MIKFENSPVAPTYEKFKRRLSIGIIILCIATAIFIYFSYLTNHMLNTGLPLFIILIIIIIIDLLILRFYKKRYFSGELPRKPS
jgi:Na+/glutamate symporter